MADEKHPTRDITVLFDPFEVPPPRGVNLLVVTVGNVLTQSNWFDGALAWGYLPKVPQSVKDREMKKLLEKQQQERAYAENWYKERSMDPPAKDPEQPRGTQVPIHVPV